MTSSIRQRPSGLLLTFVLTAACPRRDGRSGHYLHTTTTGLEASHGAPAFSSLEPTAWALHADPCVGHGCRVAASATSASAASPLTGETLRGKVTAISGSGAAITSCTQRYESSANATFNASGNATRPYAGSFVVNQGSAHLSTTVIHNKLSSAGVSVPFTITSRTTTITGTVSLSLITLNPSFLWGFGLLCNGPTVVGLDVSRSANYTATIQTRQASQVISGQANVSGSFLFKSPTESSLTVNFTG